MFHIFKQNVYIFNILDFGAATTYRGPENLATP